MPPSPPQSPGAHLSPQDLINQATGGEWALFQADPVTDSDTTVTVRCARLDTTNNGGGSLVEANIATFAPYFDQITLTRDQWKKSCITAACVVQAESGGNAGARNVNVGGPAPGSIDRGLFQFNNEAWPKITDAMADSPRIAFLLAWRITKGWQQWGPWTGSRGLDPASEPSRLIIGTYESMTGEAVGKGLFGIPDIRPVVDAVKDAVGTALGWAEALGRLLSNLIDPSWWRRIGVGALGLLLIIAAIVFAVARSDAGKSAIAATPAGRMKGAAT